MNSGGGSLLCLLGSDPRDSTSTALNSSSSKPAFIFAVNAAPFRQRATRATPTQPMTVVSMPCSSQGRQMSPEDDGAGKSGARMRLRLYCLSPSFWVHHVVRSGCELEYRRGLPQPFSDVTWWVCGAVSREADQDATSLHCAGVRDCCRMCCRARSHASWKVGRPGNLGCRADGHLKPTDREVAARSAGTSSSGCSSCCEEARHDMKRFMRRGKHFHQTVTFVDLCDKPGVDNCQASLALRKN